MADIVISNTNFTCTEAKAKLQELGCEILGDCIVDEIFVEYIHPFPAGYVWMGKKGKDVYYTYFSHY